MLVMSICHEDSIFLLEDIATFFGVNYRQISRIKDQTLFSLIEAADVSQLPEAGPYTPLRDFLGYKKNVPNNE